MNPVEIKAFMDELNAVLEKHKIRHTGKAHFMEYLHMRGEALAASLPNKTQWLAKEEEQLANMAVAAYAKSYRNGCVDGFVGAVITISIVYAIVWFFGR